MNNSEERPPTNKDTTSNICKGACSRKAGTDDSEGRTLLSVVAGSGIGFSFLGVWGGIAGAISLPILINWLDKQPFMHTPLGDLFNRVWKRK